MNDDDPKRFQETAASVFDNGFNCAQAVLVSLGPDLGLERELCFKLGSPFGAGIARRQEICGAVSGAIMALGLEHGRGENDDDNVKESSTAEINRFLDRFNEIHGSHQCGALLGLDFNTAEGKDRFFREDMLSTKCSVFIRDAVRIIMELRQATSLKG